MTIKSITRLILLLYFFVGSVKITAQNTKNEQIKRVQRSIVVFNFAQQTEWENQEESEVFKIGVLGNDRVLIDLKALSLKRKIKNKNVKITKFNSVKDINNIQLLYVNNRLNFNIDYILREISGKNILLVTEDYNFNSSMINIVNVGNSFEYEINSELLLKENLRVSNTLKASAISNSQKWKDLFKATEDSLNVIKKESEKKDAAIKNKEQKLITQQKEITTKEIEIDTFKKRVSKQSKWIEELGDINKLQKKRFEEKVILEHRLNDTIKAQIKLVNKQKETIASSHLKIKEQLDYLEKQNSEIKEKETILKEKEEEIKVYRNVNILLGFLALLTIVGGFLIYKNYLTEKKLSIALEEKNKIVEENSKLVKTKNQELEQFAYIASHDLKEPLVTITGLIHLFQEDYMDKIDESGKITLEYISDSSERMRHLIDALLEYSRLGKEKSHTKVDCNQLINILKSDLANVLERTKSTIIVKDLPTVTGSQVELRLLFQNLISNGIKFTKPDVKPIIEIDCEKVTFKKKLFWKFSVRDNGIGIAKKHQKRIFSIFQRLHSREEYEGTGIGLAHCKRIIEAHNGMIEVESKEQEGTIFFVFIPV